jgi:Fe-S-cluster-containing dehydrogenase component
VMGAAATAGASAKIEETAGADAAPAAAPAPPSGPVTPALTPDHRLIHVCPACGPAGAGGAAGTAGAEGAAGSGGVHHAMPVLSNAEIRQGVAGRKWVMVIDLAKCDGCKTCTVTCQKMHFSSPDREWIKVFQMQDSPHTEKYWFPKPCFHCDNPPCTRVCPVDATFKRQDGIVLIDNERCIGCRFCMAACPYSTRYFNWERPDPTNPGQKEPYSPERGYPRRVGTVEKCDFCPEMLVAGEIPHCAGGCPMGAIYFGDQNEDAVTNSVHETVRLSQLLADRAGYRYLEELGTDPRVYYLPPKNRMFPAPGKGK